MRFVGWADWVDCRCFLFFVFLGVARRLELSPCNTTNIHAVDAMPYLKAPTHIRKTCLQLWRIAFPDSTRIRESHLLQHGLWVHLCCCALCPLSHSPLQYCHENICRFVLPSRIAVKLVHLIHIPDMCLYIYRHRYTCQCTGFAGARAATPATKPRRKRSVIFVHDVV